MSDALISLETLITTLSQIVTAPDAFNEYAGDSADNRIRRENLHRYLIAMQQRQPSMMMVMEAPGYRGCRLTGVPVTSRKVMLEGVPELDFLGESQGYRDTSDSGFEAIYGEQSATIVWQTLATLRCVPLIWNTFPFHPHQPDKPLTNRAPRRDEIAVGSHFLHHIITLFRPSQIIAVGNVAAGALSALEVPYIKVRHPAQGGKNEFVAGLTAVVNGAH